MFFGSREPTRHALGTLLTIWPKMQADGVQSDRSALQAESPSHFRLLVSKIQSFCCQSSRWGPSSAPLLLGDDKLQLSRKLLLEMPCVGTSTDASLPDLHVPVPKGVLTPATGSVSSR